MTSNLTHVKEAAVGVGFSLPSVGVIYQWVTEGLTFLTALAALVLIVAQIGYLIWKWRREARKDRQE